MVVAPSTNSYPVIKRSQIEPRYSTKWMIMTKANLEAVAHKLRIKSKTRSILTMRTSLQNASSNNSSFIIKLFRYFIVLGIIFYVLVVAGAYYIIDRSTIFSKKLRKI
jgi:hypothetical protein